MRVLAICQIHTHTHSNTHSNTHRKRRGESSQPAAHCASNFSLIAIAICRQHENCWAIIYLFIVSLSGEGEGEKGQKEGECLLGSLVLHTGKTICYAPPLAISLPLCPLSVSISLYRYLHFVNKRGVCAIFALSRLDAAYTQFLRNFYERHLL